MKLYRSTATSPAVQYTGEPIEGVTCEGTPEQRQENGCDNTRAHMPHAHTAATGGLSCLKAGDWIMPVAGGPFCVVNDATFRAHFEVAEDVAPDPLPVIETKAYTDGSTATGVAPLPNVSPDGAPVIDLNGAAISVDETAVASEPVADVPAKSRKK